MNKCYYCERQGEELNPNSSGSQVYLCKSHMIIMNNPKFATRFLRGVLAAQMRGKIPEQDLKMMVDKFVGLISTWKPKYH